MKKTNIIYLFLLLFLFGCSEDEIETFDLNESKVFFQVQSFSGGGGSERYSTSTSYSFVGREQSLTEYVFKGTVKVMGEIKNFDRPFKVVIDKENTTMTEGVGFEINTDTLRIEAGKNSAEVAVRFFRIKDLLERSDTLTLKLEGNEFFNVLNEYNSDNNWANTTADKIDGSRYTFVMTEIYTRPDSWSGSGPLYVNSYFGEWNPIKYIFINDFFGFSPNDWVYVNGVFTKLSAGRMSYYGKKLQEELQARADSGNPVLDEDGSNMQLPAPYNVDYSKI